ncbi:MAG: PHP domain-containing protein, partial [Pseudoruegeria sp.]
MFNELSITSNFSFLTGASHPEDYARRAATLGIQALAIADENSVAGIVRAHVECREIARQVKLRQKHDTTTGLIGPPRPHDIPKPASADIYCTPRLIPAARIVLSDGFTLTALPLDRTAWGRLCRLLSKGRLRAEKGTCLLRFDDLIRHAEGVQMLLHPPTTQMTPASGADTWLPQAQRLTRRFPHTTALRIAPQYDGQDTSRFTILTALAETLNIPTIASAAPLMHHGSRR